jgi:hypothetical protein
MYMENGRHNSDNNNALIYNTCVNTGGVLDGLECPYDKTN